MKITAYHGSHVKISRFDRQFSAQGVFWFSEDKQKILSGESGAVSSQYIMTVELDIKKTAGWDEYEKFSLAEIDHMGFNSISLDDDWVMFEESDIRVIKTEMRENFIIDIPVTEDVELPNTDIILERGDTVRVLLEDYPLKY